MRRRLLAACCAASVLIAVAPSLAQAVTVRGRILGRPVANHVHARVPLLLDDGREVVLRVPVRSGFRTPDRGRTRADRTRLGDVVSARVGAIRGGRAAAAYLRIDRRSAAPAFGDLAARLEQSSAGARRAGAEVQRLAAGPHDAAAAPDPGPLRLFLLQVRYSLNLLIADLRDQAGGMSKVAGDVASLPRADALTRELRAVAGRARTAASDLEDGVTRLDELINSVGGAQGTGPGGLTLPFGTISEAGQVIDLVVQTLDDLDPQDGVPGTPTAPDPLGGVPVPAVPPVLP